MLVYKKSIKSLKQLILYLKSKYINNYIWFLYGEIGAGKTTFVQYFTNHNALSPSFAGYAVYDNILHIDTYYKNTLPVLLVQEYYDLGYNIFIEWPIYEHLFTSYNCISIHIDNDNYHIYEGINKKEITK